MTNESTLPQIEIRHLVVLDIFMDALGSLPIFDVVNYGQLSRSDVLQTIADLQAHGLVQHREGDGIHAYYIVAPDQFWPSLLASLIVRFDSARRMTDPRGQWSVYAASRPHADHVPATLVDAAVAYLERRSV